MIVDPTSDQELFRETTERYLREHVPVGEVRRLRDDPAGFEPDYWRRGADLGWTSLLVPEDQGGGSISGDGLVDLTLLAHEFGRHAAPGPLVPVNIAAATLSRATHGADDAVLGELLAGTATVAWCVAEPPPHDRLGDIAVEVKTDGADVVIDGIKRPVESAGQAGHLLVTGRTGGGPTQVLVPVDTPGVTVAPMHTVDLTRRFAAVTFEDVRLPATYVVGEVGSADRQVEHQLRLAAILSCAEAVGAMQAAFDMTVEWAFDRYSFGRPLASYQALKHRFADMKTWLEGAHAVTDAAAAAPDDPRLVSAAKAFVGDYGSELLQDCVQIHGGIGVTYEHDLHLFLRRHTVNRALYGTPADHRQLLADLERKVDAA